MSPEATTKVLDYRFCPRKKARQRVFHCLLQRHPIINSYREALLLE